MAPSTAAATRRPAAGPRLRRAGPAVPGHLPRVPGGERGDGRHAPPRDPRPAGPDEPPDAARRHPRGEVRPAPRRDVHRGRAVPAALRRAAGDDQHAARAGDRSSAGRRVVIDGRAATARPRRSMSRARRASRWRCSGTRNGAPPPIPSRARSSRPSAPPAATGGTGALFRGCARHEALSGHPPPHTRADRAGDCGAADRLLR